MITAPIMQGGVDVRLPRAEAKPLEPKSGLVVTLDREGRIFMDQAALSYADFRATFPAFVRTKRPTGVYLRADGRVPYAEVVQVLAAIRAAGVNNVGLVAEPEVVERGDGGAEVPRARASASSAPSLCMRSPGRSSSPARRLRASPCHRPIACTSWRRPSRRRTRAKRPRRWIWRRRDKRGRDP